MVTLHRTGSDNPHFHQLILALDRELGNNYGEAQSFYAQFNGIGMIRHVVIAHSNGQPVGCGAFKELEPGLVEIKRMFVDPEHRGQGIASRILSELEAWAKEEGYGRSVLETGNRQHEAIRLYERTGYERIPNYGQYAGVESSICMAKGI